MSVPVFIINRNRVTSTRVLTDWLVRIGTERVVIMDNGSTYPPLLDWYEHKMPRQVELVKVGKNLGPGSFFEHEAGWKTVDGPYFVLTDSDLMPSPTCPPDLVARCVEKMEKYPDRVKCGPSLRIDNLPPTHPRRAQNISENLNYWQHRLDEECFAAPIDTTFAVWRKKDGWVGPLDNCIRLDNPYVFEHVPWYVWPISEEERYYAERSLPPPCSHIAVVWRNLGVEINQVKEE